jgi:threonine dehydratase
MKKPLADGEIDFVREADEACQRIGRFIRETPIEYSHYLSRLGRCHVYLKLENLQITGSFKIRGATNALLSIAKVEQQRGVLAASSGNHANALAYICDQTGIKATFYVPKTASKTKIAALQAYSPDELRYHGSDVVETERFVREIAQASGKTVIPPYNDARVIAGQATIGLELKQKGPDPLDVVFVPVGGGGLIAGIAGYVKSLDSRCLVIGCQPENSAVMYESVKAGRILDLKSSPTQSDGTAGGVEKGSITFGYCQRYVDEFVLVSEDEIKEAIKLMIEQHYILVEGAATLPVAAFIKLRDRFESKNVVLVISGNKISMNALKSVLCEE